MDCSISAQAAGRIGGRGHWGGVAGARGVWRDLYRGGLRDAGADIPVNVIFRASWAVALAGIFIAKTCQLVAAADAVAVARFGRCLDGNERHRKGIVRFPVIPCKRTKFGSGSV